MTDRTIQRQVAVLADRLRAYHWQMAVAESLTGGLLAASIAAGPEASEWFKGGIVAYQAATKRKLLGVSDGPVVTQRCATEMARGAASLLDAAVGLAVTGVGGPGPAEGHPPGTVWIAVHTPRGDTTHLARLEADEPSDVCAQACVVAVDLATQAVEAPS